MGSLRHLASALVLSALGGFFCGACGTGSGSTTSNGSGGASSGVGGTSSGAAGATSSGGAAGASSGCRTAADCPQSTTPPAGAPQCLSPGQPAPSGGCGAPQWCGQCACPPMPLAPSGNGLPCETNAECPAAMPDVSTASVCAMGTCTQCAANTDCPATLPYCGSVQIGFAGGLGFRVCQACLTDTDCASPKPHCAFTGGVSSCVACASTSDCATGVCSSGTCIAGCTSDAQCGSPLLECSAVKRCEARSCASDEACPPNAACVTGHCQRRACTGDQQCDQGACVNGACYEAKGTCFTQMLYP